MELRERFFFSLYTPFSLWPQNLKSVFIGDPLTEFSIEKYKKVKGGWIMALKNLNSRLEAEQLKSKEVFLPKRNFKTKKGESIYLAS